MVTRRQMILGALGAGALAGAGAFEADQASALRRRRVPRTSAPITTPAGSAAAPSAGSKRIGYTVVNQIDSRIAPYEAFVADIDRVASSGGDAVRIGLPIYFAGGVFNGQWRDIDHGLGEVRRQLQYATSRGMAVSVTLAAPTGDPGDPSLGKFLEVNRQAVTSIAQQVGQYVSMWQVFNEFNTCHYRTHANVPQPISGDYLDEIKSCFDVLASAIRAASPGARVTSSVGGYPSDQRMWQHWEDLYNRVGGSLDAWGVIAYPDPSVPAQWPQQAQWMQHMKQTSGKPVVVLETGMCTPSERMAQQAVGAVPGMLRGLAAGEPEMLFAYQLRDIDTSSGDGQCRFGVYTTDGRTKAHWAPTRDAMWALRY